MIPPTEPLPLPQISGWVKIHSTSPQILAHDPTNITAKDLALTIEPSVLNILIPQIQINSRVWISGTILRTDPKFLFITVTKIAYHPPAS
ncbi:hypothetical protein PGT21_020787 [Puccinia graminis f. sp. tritici]|uniref:Uncharacterized protein n=1 Tax=Puccinia graminis f. sp. tritici TaxID=56615 RepID=A0A5B0MCK8_PUCGR|nr:hypothetical protein PGT21_020787 [Puccinia graminis f. sp. tritici]